MKKTFTKLFAALALLAFFIPSMIAVGQTRESYSVTYGVSDLENMFQNGSSYASANGYWKVPETANNSAIINIPITYQPTSDITITFSIATFGSGTNPSSSNTTITATGTETSSNWTGSGVSSYPSSSTYVNGVMTITKPQNPTTLAGLDITMGVNSGIKIFRLQSITIEYTYGGGTPTTYTVTFNAGAGTFVGNTDFPNTSNTVTAGTYTLPSANPATGYTFDGWLATGSSTPVTGSYQVSGNVDFTAQYTDHSDEQWVKTDLSALTTSDIFVIVGNNGSYYAMKNSASNSGPVVVAVSVSDNKITSAVSDDIKWNISGNTTDGFVFYPDNSTTTWLYCNNDNNGLRVGSGNVDYKTFEIKDNYIYNKGRGRYIGIYQSTNWRSYTSIGSNIASQTFGFYKKVSGTVPPSISADDVNIDYNATSGSITYTINDEPATPGTLTATLVTGYTIANLNVGTPADGTITFTCGANTETSEHTATVTLAYTYGNNNQVTKTITITQAAKPTTYTTIPTLFAAATGTETDVFVTFNNWVVSGVSTNGKNVFVTDNNGNGFVMYFSDDMSSSFAAGNILSGTAVACKLKKYNGFAELLNVNANDLTITTGGSVTASTIALADLAGVNTGALVHYENLECQVSVVTNNTTNTTTTYYYLTDGTTSIQVYNSLYAFNALEDGEYYNITGVYQQYNNYKEILPRSVADIVKVEPAKVDYYYSRNGVLSSVNTCAVGSTKTLEAHGTDPYSDFHFVGWTTDANDVSQRLTSYTFQNDTPVTFYAVYEHVKTYNTSSSNSGSYVKVTQTSDITNGNYLIVYEGENDYNVAFDGSLTTLDAGHNNIAVTISDGTIASTNTTDAAVFTINVTSTDQDYVYGTLKSASGFYIGVTSNNNGLLSNETTEYPHKFSIDSDNAKIWSNFTGSTMSLRFNASSGDNNDRFRYYKSSGQQPVQLYKYVGSGPTPITTTAYYTRIFNETAQGDITVIGPSIIPSYGTLDMGNHSLAHDSHLVNYHYLVIEDGGQLIYTGGKIKSEVQKYIAQPSGTWGEEDNTGWYALSSPIGGEKISEVTNMKVPAVGGVQQYDFFKYAEDFGWYNKKNGSYLNFMDEGEGFLYARAESAVLGFRGETRYDEVEITGLSLHNSMNNPGLHFIGNPYTYSIYKGTNIIGDLNTGYYTLNASGAWISTSDNIAIAPLQGVLVFVSKNNADVTIVPNTVASAKSTKSNNDYIRFTVANSQYEDVAYAWFDKGEGLKKINHRNSEVPMVYIPQNDVNYGIATMDDNTKSFNLNFKAMTTGKYTLSYKTQGEFDYMHIYDRLTGEDVDMLLEGEYSFIGSPSDNDARFIVSLNYSAGNINANDSFVYQNGSEIIVNGEGELQIFDVMGRNIMNTMINGVQTVNVKSQGVYIFKLNEKTQKVIVR